MITGLAARWLVTAVFAAAGLGTLLAQGRACATPAADRVSDVFHLLMCPALIAMTWWSEPTPAVWLQAALFGCAVIWFGLGGTAGSVRFWPASLANTHHAVMAGGMIWMLTATPADASMASTGAAHAVMPAMARHALPARSNPVMSHPAMPAAVLAVSVVLAVYFALAALPWMARTIGPVPRVNGRAACQAAMSAGMATMLLAMF